MAVARGHNGSRRYRVSMARFPSQDNGREKVETDVSTENKAEKVQGLAKVFND